MLKVKDIMTRNVIACQPHTSVREVARLMYLNGLSGLPVIDEADQLVGIITEADLVKKYDRLQVPKMLGFLGSLIYLDNPINGDEIQKQLREILAKKVSDLMSDKPTTIIPEAPLDDLAGLFLQKRANPVPVVDGGQLVGIVSRSDIVKLMAGEEELRKQEWKDLAIRG